MQQDGIRTQITPIQDRHQAEPARDVPQTRRVTHAWAHEAGLQRDAVPIRDARLRVEHMQCVGLQRAISETQQGMRRRKVAGGNEPRIGWELGKDAGELLQGDLLHATSVTLKGEVFVQHSLLKRHAQRIEAQDARRRTE